MGFGGGGAGLWMTGGLALFEPGRRKGFWAAQKIGASSVNKLIFIILFTIYNDGFPEGSSCFE